MVRVLLLGEKTRAVRKASLFDHIALVHLPCLATFEHSGHGRGTGSSSDPHGHLDRESCIVLSKANLGGKIQGHLLNLPVYTVR